MKNFLIGFRVFSLFLLSCFGMWAIAQKTLAFEIGSFHGLKRGGSLQSLEGGTLNHQHVLEFYKRKANWAYEVLVYDKKTGRLLFEGRPQTISSVWFERGTKPLEGKNLVNFNELYQEFLRTTRATKGFSPRDCLSGFFNSSSSLPASFEGSLFRNTGNGEIKDREELDQYLFCHKKPTRLKDRAEHEFYVNKLSPTIDKIVKHYGKTVKSRELQFKREEIGTLFRCLLFQETKWRDENSHTGAVGLGQFTNVAISDVMEQLQIRPLTFEKSESYARKILGNCYTDPSNRSTRQEISCAVEINRYQRAMVMQDLFNRIKGESPALREFWRRFGNKDYTCKRSDPYKGCVRYSNNRDMRNLRNALSDNQNNYEAILTLSMLHVLNYQMEFSQVRTKGISPVLNELPSYYAPRFGRNTFFLASGAYNMGMGAFGMNAFGRGASKFNLGDIDLAQIIENLESSRHRQKIEIKRHLISIQRCAQRGENLPMCGETLFCRGTQRLPKSDLCSVENHLSCDSREELIKRRCK